MGTGKKFDEFIANTLLANTLDLRGQLLENPKRLFLNFEVEVRGKPDGTQQPKTVFLKTRLWIADGANQSRRDILFPIHKIKNFIG